MRSEVATFLDQRFQPAIDVSPCAMLVVNEDGVIELANPVAERLFGYDRGELSGRSVEDLIPQGARERHRAHRREYHVDPAARPMGLRRDLLGVRRDGTEIPLEIGLSPFETLHGIFVVAAIVDLTERKEFERHLSMQAEQLEVANAKLSQMAATDSLTETWNRRAFLDQIGIQMELALRTGRPMSIMIIDLDEFKPYNDAFGHMAGDEVLQQAAAIMRKEARRSDYVARIGGEEFAVILPETGREGTRRLAERYRSAIDEATWPRRKVTASIGAATLALEQAGRRPPPDWRSRLMAAADRALYHSKQQGRNRVTHVDELA